MARHRTHEHAGGAPKAIACQPVTPDRWADLVTLFGPHGACGGCWCQYWRVPPQVFAAGKVGGNQQALERRVAAGPAPGVLAYDGGRPIGWCAVAPRDELPRLDRSRVLARVDAAPVWAITCLFVARAARGTGVSVPLIAAAAAYAHAQGATIVEAYPVEPRTRQADAFVWTGLASAFTRAGFVEVARRSPTRPIMRHRRPERR